MTGLVIDIGFVLPVDHGIDGRNPIIGYDNILRLAPTITASSEIDTSPVSNLRDGSTYQAWQADSAGAQEIIVDNGVAAIADYFGIAVHNIARAGSSVVLAYSTNGTDYTDIGDPISPAADGVIFVRFATITARYWRLTFASGSVPLRMAVLYIGQLLVLQRRIYSGHAPHTFGRRTVMAQGRSEAGHFLGRVIKQEFLEHTIEQKNLTPAWARSYLLPFYDAARLVPFFWAWRPSQYPLEAGFGWLTDDPNGANSGVADLMQATLKVQSITPLLTTTNFGDS
jgi:hypothetical protein